MDNKEKRKKIKIELTDNKFRKRVLLHNKISNKKNLIKIEDEDDFLYDYSTELLNENKISGILTSSPFINPVPSFTVRNENSKKEIKTRFTFFQNLKTQINLSKSNKQKRNDSRDHNNVLKEKTKIINKNIRKSQMNQRYFRPYSPNIERKKNKLFSSENQIINNNKMNKNRISYEIILDIKKASNLDKINNSKEIYRKKNHKKINHFFYSTDDYFGSHFNNNIKTNDDKKAKKIALLKILGQNINVASMKIELLKNYIKNKNLNSIKAQIECNKICCNNDLQRLKDKYYNKIQNDFKQIKILKMKLSKAEDNFLTINKHKDIISKEELDFKNKKLVLIEKIIFLKKYISEIMNPYSNKNEKFFIDESFEEQTIKDISFNEYSIVKETIASNYINSNNFNNNKAFFNEEALYENNTKNQPKKINLFQAKFINTVKEKKHKKLYDN